MNFDTEQFKDGNGETCLRCTHLLDSKSVLKDLHF